MLIALFAASSVSAISDNAGTKNGAFLKIATDARGVAIGPGIVSMAQGIEGLRWNPAALGALETSELSSTHVQYYQGAQIENVGFAYPLSEEGALAAGGFYLSPGSLDGRDALGNATGDFQFYDLVGSVGYGRRIQSREEGMEIYAGGALKIVQEKIADTQYQNAALDAGILAAPWEDFKAGLCVRNLSTGQANFPKEGLLGASYTFFRAFTGALALRYADDAPLRFSVGGEYLFLEAEGIENAVLRAGYQNHDPLDNSTDSDISALRGASLAGLAMGAGFEVRPPFFKTLRLQLDYAMAPFGALGIAHTITVKAKW